MTEREFLREQAGGMLHAVQRLAGDAQPLLSAAGLGAAAHQARTAYLAATHALDELEGDREDG